MSDGTIPIIGGQTVNTILFYNDKILMQTVKQRIRSPNCLQHLVQIKIFYAAAAEEHKIRTASLIPLETTKLLNFITAWCFCIDNFLKAK